MLPCMLFIIPVGVVELVVLLLLLLYAEWGLLLLLLLVVLCWLECCFWEVRVCEK